MSLTLFVCVYVGRNDRVKKYFDLIYSAKKFCTDGFSGKSCLGQE